MKPLRAFTLIEILVVVAIIALLIAILFPSLAAARETARRTICGTQLGEMSRALLMYNGENKDFLPGPIHAALELETVEKTANYDHETWHLPSFLRRYFSDRSKAGQLTDNVVRCPTAEAQRGTLNLWGKTEARRPFTYSLNNWNAVQNIRPGTVPQRYFGWPDDFWTSGAADAMDRFTARVNPSEISKPKKISQIKQHGREWAIGDAFCYTDDTRPLVRSGQTYNGDWRIGTYQSESWAQSTGIPDRPYHDRGINVAMFDGHVEYQRPWRGSVNCRR